VLEDLPDSPAGPLVVGQFQARQLRDVRDIVSTGSAAV
jgi:hypothetical protein